MTPEQLLLPRILVKLNYPDSDFQIGQILNMIIFEDNEIGYLFPHHKLRWKLNFFNKFPLIFHQLKWYEKRELNELPKYLKFNNQHYEVKEWKSSLLNDGNYPVFKNPLNLEVSILVNWDFWGKYAIPVTEESYKSFLELN